MTDKSIGIYLVARYAEPGVACEDHAVHASDAIEPISVHASFEQACDAAERYNAADLRRLSYSHTAHGRRPR